jgi:hypothetical protein
VKRVRCRSSALVVVVVAWVVPVGSSTVGKIRSEPDPWCLGALAVPEAYLEVESLCCFFPCGSPCVFFTCGVRWFTFPCFFILVLSGVPSVGSHGWRHLLIQKLGVPCLDSCSRTNWILMLETCALRKQTTPLGLSGDCLPRLSSGVRVSNRF